MPIKILIVLDGDYRFGDGATPAGTKDFTFNTLVNALSLPGVREVTKANRGPDSTASPGMDNFTFDDPDVNLLDYDVIWLIGNDGRNSQETPPSGSSTPEGLGPGQLNALAAFMDHGGGVFATGDHDSVGADMGGHVPRVRLMRSWYGANDPAKPADLAAVPANFPPVTIDRADTIRINPNGQYTEHPEAAPFLWFENQSDSVPQPIAPTSPTHPILRRNGTDIVVFPDHMHEGRTLDEVDGHDYALNSPFGDTTKPEFREIAGHRELPRVIATGQVISHSVFAAVGTGTDTTQATEKSVNTLSAYDGRVAGVGRIVTGSTFHHYIDINLTGDFDIKNGLEIKVGPDAMKGHGFGDNAAVFDDIKAVFVNITEWLARPRPAIGLILERSTFSQAEVGANPQFEGAILLTVDGLKPSQFPDGGIPALGAIAGMPSWVPAITPPIGIPISIEPTFVSSDDPSKPDRLQRFTFTYRVRFTGDAFGFADPVSSTVPIQATLAANGVSVTLTDQAWLQLVKSANPFMLDLADDNTTSWLSSDVKVFHVVAGDSFLGEPLPANANRDQALTFIRNVASNITMNQFRDLPSAQESSTLSPLETTTGMPSRRVYNFALARVRLSAAGADANQVRVFFRIFTSQTTAALTYHVDGSGMPVDGYRKSADADPIALPGTKSGGNEWVSFPFFARTRTTPQQQDPHTIKNISAATGFKVFGALLDNNLPDLYLTHTPLGGAMESLPDLMTGEHQCIVAQVEFAGAPIPDGATPWTSDKLSQRNIAFSEVANPGLDASRVAMHTFEIESTPHAIGDATPPDELLLDWSRATPDGTTLRLHIPSWKAADVVALADRFYPRHEIEAVDEHTIELPGGGTRYVPIPMSKPRQTGVISVELPLGIKRGQRFDVSVRQVTNRFRQAPVPPPRVTEISLAEAEKIVAAMTPNAPGIAGVPQTRGIDLGENRVLITDLSVFDAPSDHALIVEHPDPEVVKAAMAEAGRWREPVGAFQLAIPVSTKDAMLLYHMRLLSVMRWRAARLPRRSRWRKTMLHYLELLAAKVQALGGNPFAIPATPDGAIPQLPGGTGGDGGTGTGTNAGGELGQAIEVLIRELFRRPGCWLLLIVFLIVVLVLLWFALT